MKQLNFRHVNINSKKILWNNNLFSKKKQKRLQKGEYCFV